MSGNRPTTDDYAPITTEEWDAMLNQAPADIIPVGEHHSVEWEKIAAAFPRDRDGVPVPPTARELALRPEILAEAEEICAVFGDATIPASALELLVRAVVWSDRVLSDR